MRLNTAGVVSLLKKRDMRQKTLSEKTGISKSTISMICNGKSCTEDTARKIAAALDVTIDELIETR